VVRAYWWILGHGSLGPLRPPPVKPSGLSWVHSTDLGRVAVIAPWVISDRSTRNPPSGQRLRRSSAARCGQRTRGRQTEVRLAVMSSIAFAICRTPRIVRVSGVMGRQLLVVERPPPQSRSVTWAPSLFGQTAGGMSLVDSLGPRHFIARNRNRNRAPVRNRAFSGGAPACAQGWCRRRVRRVKPTVDRPYILAWTAMIRDKKYPFAF
jgi:hypothetical protein